MESNCSVQSKVPSFLDSLMSLLFFRVQVLEVSQKEDNWGLGSVLVKFIDEGRTKLIARDKLLLLPEKFHTLPPQAVEFIVCRVKPADSEIEWNPKVGYFSFLCFIDLRSAFNPEYTKSCAYFKCLYVEGFFFNMGFHCVAKSNHELLDSNSVFGSA